jgi:hypothetical protein
MGGLRKYMRHLELKMDMVIREMLHIAWNILPQSLLTLTGKLSLITQYTLPLPMLYFSS